MTYHLDSLCKDCCIDARITVVLMSVSELHLLQLALSWGSWTYQSHGESPRLFWGQSNTLPCMECSDLDSISHVGMVVVQHSDTSDEHAKMLHLDGGTKISERTTVALYVDSDVRFHSCPCTKKQYYWVI